MRLHEEQVSYNPTNDRALKNMLSPSNIVDEENDGPSLGDNLEKGGGSAKKKLVIDCNLEKKIFCLPENVLFELLTYLLPDYPRLIQVSSVWYFKINELFDDHMVSLDNSFIQTYMKILAF